MKLRSEWWCKIKFNLYKYLIALLGVMPTVCTWQRFIFLLLKRFKSGLLTDMNLLAVEQHILAKQKYIRFPLWFVVCASKPSSFPLSSSQKSFLHPETEFPALDISSFCSLQLFIVMPLPPSHLDSVFDHFELGHVHRHGQQWCARNFLFSLKFRYC